MNVRRRRGLFTCVWAVTLTDNDNIRTAGHICVCRVIYSRIKWLRRRFVSATPTRLARTHPGQIIIIVVGRRRRRQQTSAKRGASERRPGDNVKRSQKFQIDLSRIQHATVKVPGRPRREHCPPPSSPVYPRIRRRLRFRIAHRRVSVHLIMVIPMQIFRDSVWICIFLDIIKDLVIDRNLLQ